jgi:NADH-quinone oxidoreductase subunit M
MNLFTTSWLLSWITFLPLIGAALILPVLGLRAAGVLSRGAADQVSRVLTLIASGFTLVLALFLWRVYDPGNPALQFVQQARWIPAYNIEYFVGVDGISITLVILSALISFIATIASMPWWPGNAHLDDHHFTKQAVPGYMAMLLILQTGMLGVFVAMDMFLFYVFWEVMLLPMYFLIGIWGGARKEYAAIKFFLYTLAGSVLMLLAIIGLYYNGPTEVVNGQLTHTFNMVKMAQWGRAGGYMSAPLVLGLSFVKVAWVALFIGFAIKIPMFPFHT